MLQHLTEAVDTVTPRRHGRLCNTGSGLDRSYRRDFGGRSTWHLRCFINVTTIKRSHLVDLRSAIAAVFSARGLPTPAWSDPTITPSVTVVRAVHITEPRAAVLALE